MLYGFTRGYWICPIQLVLLEFEDAVVLSECQAKICIEDDCSNACDDGYDLAYFARASAALVCSRPGGPRLQEYSSDQILSPYRLLIRVSET